MNGPNECVSLIKDGILKLGDNIQNIIFHQNLNVFLVVTAQNEVRVYDPHSSLKLTEVPLHGFGKYA